MTDLEGSAVEDSPYARGTRRALCLCAGILIAAALAAGRAWAASTEPVALVEGPYVGTALQVNTQGPALVEPRNNKDTKADGFLAGPAPDCPDVSLEGKTIRGVHYHGKLFGRPDPDPTHCGWGRVILASQASPLFMDTVVAIQAEQLIATEIRRTRPHASEIERNAKASLDNLREAYSALIRAWEAGEITDRQYVDAKPTLKYGARHHDEDIEKWSKELEGAQRSHDRAKVRELKRKIRQANDSGLLAKRNTLKDLPENVFLK